MGFVHMPGRTRRRVGFDDGGDVCRVGFEIDQLGAVLLSQQHEPLAAYTGSFGLAAGAEAVELGCGQGQGVRGRRLVEGAGGGKGHSLQCSAPYYPREFSPRQAMMVGAKSHEMEPQARKPSSPNTLADHAKSRVQRPPKPSGSPGRLNSMETLMLTLSSGAVSGIRPYLMLLLLGLSGRFFSLDIVPAALQRTDVLVIAGVLVLVDFAADKIALFDSFWDTAHTIIRPVAGGAIGYLLGGETSTANALVLAVVGAASAFGVHATKTSARAVVNLSPEPVSNVAVSTGEDIAAFFFGIFALLLPILAGFVALTFIILGVFITVYLVRRVIPLLKKRREGKTA